MPSTRSVASDHAARRDSIRWFALAVIALVVSGALAVVLVIGRTPVLAPALIRDVDFARRCLVVHVNLAITVWFFAFVAGLYRLSTGPRSGLVARGAAGLASCGVIAFSIPMGLRAATPLLSNYVPVLDHWLFLAGLAAFAVGLSVSLVMGLVSGADARSIIPVETRYGVTAAAITVLVAMGTLVAAALTTPAHASALVTFERIFWGGGHVLQVSATMAMLACWLLLANRLSGKPVMSNRLALWLFAVMALPTLLAPWFATSAAPDRWFTTWMQLGFAPGVLVIVWCVVTQLVRTSRVDRRVLRTPAFLGLVTSMAMTVVGFVFGAGISANTTLTPAHYHMNIGAVTVTFMTTIVALLPAFAAPITRPRLARWQPLLYGAGQTMFATGLAIAGFWGHAARKIYGPEQMVGPGSEHAGLVIAGIGGAFALAGGFLFFVLVASAWRRRYAPTNLARLDDELCDESLGSPDPASA